MRYNKIFDTPEINRICFEQHGVTTYEFLACGTAMLGHFVDTHSLRLPLTSQIAALPIEKFAAVLALVADDIGALKRRLKEEQRYDERFTAR